MQRGSFQLMKSLNRSIILNIIRTQGPISRAEIAKLTNLTPPTVSNIVKELIDSGIVVESSQGESNGGRKPTMLKINASNFYIIGLDVGPKYLRVIMSDLNCQLIEVVKSTISLPTTNDALLAHIINEIHKVIKKNEDEQEKIIGIGVGIHGMVDVDNGISLFAPDLNLRDIPIKEVLEKEFNMIVHVENDARVMALGEAWFGNGNGQKNVMTVNVGRGIGAGIIFNGKLYHGEHFIAGEIGHMTIDISGSKCSCGNYGCLQTLAAGPAIAERAIKEIAIGRDSILKQLVDNDLKKIDGKLVYEAAVQGDKLSIEVLNQTGRYLGIGLTNVIHTLNPAKIVIGGGVSKAGDFILQSLKETIQQRALTNSAKYTEIALSSLGDNGTAIGAVTLILVELFSSTATD